MVSPTGDPSCYIICGAKIAIREQDAKQILVEVDGRPAPK